VFRSIALFVLLVVPACAEQVVVVSVQKDGTYILDGQAAEILLVTRTIADAASKAGHDGPIAKMSVEIRSDGLAPARCLSDLLEAGARAGVAEYQLVVEGKSLPIHLPTDSHLDLVEIDPEGVEKPGVKRSEPPLEIRVNLCGVGNPVTHVPSSEHIRHSATTPVEEQGWCWNGAAPVVADEAVATPERIAAVAEASAKAYHAAKEGGGKANLIVDYDANVTLRDVHALLSALASHNVHFEFAAPSW